MNLPCLFNEQLMKYFGKEQKRESKFGKQNKLDSYLKMKQRKRQI